MLESVTRLCASRPKLALFSLLFLLSAFFLYRPFATPSQPRFPSFPKEDFSYPGHVHHAALNQTRPKRVAIVGAGASGSSAAWFLRRAGRVMEERIGAEEGGLLGEIVVFDQEGYVGGRTATVYPHGDKRLRPIEVGASVFVEANRHLMKSAKHFNLNLEDPDFGSTGLGIWDGYEFLFTTSMSKGVLSNFWDSLSALRRYGPMSPIRTTRAVKDLLTKYAHLYNPVWLGESGASRSVEDFAERCGLGKALTTRRGDEWALDAVKVSEKWMGEIMEGSTRVNYASDMPSIHGMGASVSMAASGAMAVEGGNWRIFEAMLDEAKVSLHLGTKVMDIVPLSTSDRPSFEIQSNDSALSLEPFDAVFLAAPWHSSKAISSLTHHLSQPIEYHPYIHLHVTLLTTTRSSPLPSLFNLPDSAPVPNTILTTGLTSRQSGRPPPRFQSITWHGETFAGSGEWVVKIFSLTRVNDRFIRALIGEDPSWLLRKEWDSYPLLKPVASYAPVEPVKGLQYLAAQEAWVSTMETQTLSGREAVARVVEDWWGLGYGECRGGADAWDWSCER